MKKNLMLMASPVLLLLLLLLTGYEFVENTKSSAPVSESSASAMGVTSEANNNKNWVHMSETATAAGSDKNIGSIHDMIRYALSLKGSPYRYAGVTPSGFDCSGFVTHVFDTFHIEVPHSSALQAGEGVPVAKREAAPGDLVIFTGTDETKREPGHVGIVISAPGDTISFVHASSNGGVKVSKVQGTRYDLRFLEVRRVL